MDKKFSNKQLERLFCVYMECDRIGNPIRAISTIEGYETMIRIGCLNGKIKTTKATKQLWIYGEDGTYRGYISDMGRNVVIDKNGLTFSDDFDGAKITYNEKEVKYECNV